MRLHKNKNKEKRNNLNKHCISAQKSFIKV